MSTTFRISPDYLTLEQIALLMSPASSIELSDESKRLIQNCRRYLEQKLQTSNAPFYGINTGFGSLCNIRISNQEVEELQVNLVRSHASGTGEEVPSEVVRMMLLLKIQSLSYGHSGVRLATVEQLLYFLNEGIYPVIYQLGSLGASGDLAPLAHLSLALIGEGKVRMDGRQLSAKEALAQRKLEPLILGAKEGLALLNGTQFSTAYLVWGLLEAARLWEVANCCAAISIEAFDGLSAPFDDRLHQIRRQQGQIHTAAAIREWLKDSEIWYREKPYVQDPYAFRCVPQVHGASWDAFQYGEQIALNEVNAVTDNPNLFPESDAILSGGNFHAQPIALALDFLAIAAAELGSISERRTFQLLSGARHLPPFLIENPGLHSGLMIPQYTAASIVSQNKQLCTPASVDSIVSSNGQEDHVSMAANAGTKAYRVVQNVERILAIEFMTAAQALHFRSAGPAPGLRPLLEAYRKVVPVLLEDRILSEDIEKTIFFLREYFPKR
jgi:histidine ammonia-lyase